MSGDDLADEEHSSETSHPSSETAGSGGAADADDDATTDVRERIEEGADRAAQQIDESVVDLLSWVLDTETRARIYVELRQHPDSTSEEVADGTGLYPSTVREALAELHEEGKVERNKRESDGAGNNPYEYRAMAPTELVQDVVSDVQRELNTVFNLDDYLGGEESEAEPVTINVEEESPVHDDVETAVEETEAEDASEQGDEESSDAVVEPDGDDESDASEESDGDDS